jgi:peroxiredoxin
VPEAPKKSDGSIDSAFAYYYFRTHYFDNINLLDNRILRTPIFEQKFVYYFEKVIPQIPDSIIAEADRMVQRVKADPEMFKFVVHTITYNFERSQIMCMDAVFVHMVDSYYRNGLATWVDKKTMDKMIERADKLKPVLCGQQVMNITLPDTNRVWHSLYDNKGDITILYFWDATCSHCKKATPQLKELYESYLKPKGIQVFAVEGELEDDEWIKYLRENHLPWINVSDNPDMNKNPEKYILEMKVTDLNSLNFRHHFDLSSYPVLFVLDKDKKIIAKKLGVEQLQDFIDKYQKRKAVNK